MKISSISHPLRKDSSLPMKKVLILASVASMIDQFTMPNIHILIKKGFKVHAAANFEEGNTSSPERITEFKKELEALGVIFFQIEFSREITNVRSNFRAYRQIKKLMLQNDYSFVHCHSPIGGVCGRLAGRATGTKVIYTAHGFHFFKGAPIINWLLFYPVERFLARYTDVLITINKEDYAVAQRFSAKMVKYVPGIGVDTKRFETHSTYNRGTIRAKLGIKDERIVFVSVGELNKGKNHECVIRALSHLPYQEFTYLICGIGSLDIYLLSLVRKLGLEKRVFLLGFRKDIPEILSAADVFLFPSLREGLPVALMEAMASGLPVVCSNIRGNSDLIEGEKGGYLVAPNEKDFRSAIEQILNNRPLWKKMGEFNKQVISEYDVSVIEKHTMEIYAI